MTVILISGLPGCGSSTIGKQLAEKLASKYFSVDKEYKNYGNGKNETEKAINILGSEKGIDKSFNKSLDEKQRRLACEGNIVIDSKMAIHFLKNIANLGVWLHAPFEKRAERIAKREKCKIETAKSMLSKKERLEHELFMKVYNFNYLSRSPCVLPHPKGCGLFGLLDAQKLK